MNDTPLTWAEEYQVEDEPVEVKVVASIGGALVFVAACVVIGGLLW